MRRIEVLFIAFLQTIWSRKSPHAKVNHGRAQIAMHPIQFNGEKKIVSYDFLGNVTEPP